MTEILVPLCCPEAGHQVLMDTMECSEPFRDRAERSSCPPSMECSDGGYTGLGREPGM